MRFVRRMLLLALFAGLALWWLLPGRGPEVEPGSVLALELSGTYVEAAEPSLIGRLMGQDHKAFVGLLSELAKAQRDDRIAGVALRIRRMQIGWGRAQELRDAIADLRGAGKRTLAYLETGALGANVEYYLASAADQVVISPATSSPVIGLGMEFYFLGGLWEKLGAGFDAIGSGKYKSGAQEISGKKMTDAHREMAESLLDSAWEQFVAGIAEGRKLSPEAVRAAIDTAPITPEQVQRMGLADGVDTFDAALSRLGGNVVEGDDYAAVSAASVGFEPVAKVALVYGSGAVVMGRKTTTSGGLQLLSSDTVSEALEDAAGDPEIDAIIFRVDSPGGSPLASDIIWRAAERAKAQGKPFVASVSNVAASGGYYVLAGADAVVAPPSSLVGSIGVYVMRPTIGGLLDKLAIGHEVLKRGRYADLLIASEPLSDAGRERLREEILGLYDLFVARVSAGRKLSAAQVDEVGRGRVWTGAQALERGLVDELGGLRVAARRVKRALGLAEDADVALIPYPAPRTLAQEVADALSGVSARALPQTLLPLAVRQLEPLVTALPGGAPLLVPPFVLEIR